MSTPAMIKIGRRPMRSISLPQNGVQINATMSGAPTSVRFATVLFSFTTSKAYSQTYCPT